MQDDAKKAKLDRAMAEAQDNPLFHTYAKLDAKNWEKHINLIPNVYWGHFEAQYFPTFLNRIVHYYAYEEWCQEHYSHIDTEKCLAAFLEFKKTPNNAYGKDTQALDSDKVDLNQH